MKRSNIMSILALMSLIFALAACGDDPAPAGPDVQATVDAAVAATDQARVAATEAAAQIQAAVNATLTAEAGNVPPTATAVPPTVPPAPNTPTLVPPTPVPPTPVPPTPIPPTPTPPLLVVLPIAGDDGNDNLRGSSPQNNGRNIILPGFRPNEASDPMVFRDRMVIRVEVFDARVGLRDGDGIQNVTFRVIGDNGAGPVLYERTERQAGYCIFGGGEPDCNVLFFSAQNRHWPGTNTPINNAIYLLEIDILARNGDQTQWRVRFDIDAPGFQPPSGNGPQVRIRNIDVANGRYLVDYEVIGYQPQLPGQHIHFFFDTVSPNQAGIPGGGPWLIHPANPGEQATNPFSGYRVSDRPGGASQICALVANPDHSVQQGTGNCFGLP